MKLSSVSVATLVGRYVANEHGAEFLLSDVRVTLPDGVVIFELTPLDSKGAPVKDGGTVGVPSLLGWTVL